MPTNAQNYGDANEFITDPNILLFEFWEEGSSTIHRAAHNNEDITSNGEVYAKADLGLTLPTEGESLELPSLSITNVGRIAGGAVLAATKKIRCRMMLVQRGSHDTVIFDTKDMMVLQKTNVDRYSVAGDLAPSADPLLPSIMPATSKHFFPGLWL